MAMNPNAMKDAAAKMADSSVQNAGPSKEEQRKRTIKSPSQIVGDLLQRYSSQIREALGKAMDVESFVRLLITTITQCPDLLRAVSECPASLIGAILQAANLKLEPNTPLGLCYLIPYFELDKVASAEAGRKIYKMRVSFQLGYKGVLLLAYRSGLIEDVDVQCVYEKDQFKAQLGTTRFINHIPYDGADAGAVIKYYAVINLKTGGTPFKIWPRAKVEAHAKKFAKSWNEQKQRFFGPWADNFDSMAMKTVLLDCLKLIPQSPVLSLQLATDNTTKSVSENTPAENILLAPNEDFQPNGDNAAVGALPAASAPALPDPKTSTGDAPNEAHGITEPVYVMN